MKKVVTGRPYRTVLWGIVGLSVGVTVTPAPAQADPRQVTVVMDNMRYGRIPAGLKVGDTIKWVNRDTVPHTITARNKSFDLRISPGKGARMTLSQPGSIPFYCIYHPAMRGSVTVSK